jgi:hypothetical protein
MIHTLTASNLSIDYLNKADSIVTRKENIMKLIYAIQGITIMLMFNISGAWSHGHNRAFRRSDCDHDKGEVRANGNVPHMIEGNDYCIITGDVDPLGHCKSFGDWPC